MTLHRQTAELLAAVAALGLPGLEDQTPEEAREQRRAMLRPSPEIVAEVRDIDAGGVPARLYRPTAVRSAGLLLWFHGGGWVLGDLDRERRRPSRRTACGGSTTSTCPAMPARPTTRASRRCSLTMPASPRRRRPGVATSHIHLGGQIHGFFSMFGLLDDCRSAQAMVAEAVHTAFATSG